MLSHKALIDDINSCTLTENEAAFWWLGQHSFILKTYSKIIYFDPFLSEHPNRLLQPLLNAAELRENADIVLGSHDHIDHIDHDLLKDVAAQGNSITFIVPELLRKGLQSELNINHAQIFGCDDDCSIELEEVKITGIAAAHEFLDQDEKTKQYPYLGYIVEVDGMVFCHSGDTCIYEGMYQRLKQWNFDIVFLPINGRDAGRLRSGCIGNMTYQEAADLSGALKPKLTVPGHYGMFAKNTIDPDLFRDYMNVKYPDLKVCVCEPGTKYMYRKNI